MENVYQITTSIIAVVAIIIPFIITESNNRFKIKIELQRNKLELIAKDFDYQTGLINDFLNLSGLVLFGTSSDDKTIGSNKLKLQTTIIMLLPYIEPQNRITFHRYSFDPSQKGFNDCLPIISKKLTNISQEKQQLLSNRNILFEILKDIFRLNKKKENSNK